MHHDSRISLISPLPPLDMPSIKNRTHNSKPSRPRTSRPRSTGFDPEDLSARLSAVIAEREGLERNRRRSAAADSRARPPLPDLTSDVVPSSVDIESLDLENGFARTRSRKTQSFAAPTGLEYPWHGAPARVRGDESAERRNCPLLSEPMPSLATSARSSSTRRDSHASASRTTAYPHLDDRQTPRNLSAEFLNSPPTSPRCRRRSSLWEGLHEPTIFEAIASDSKPADRRTMFEPAVREYSADPSQPRRMSAGDALKTLEGSPPERRVSFEPPHYEVVNEHRVDWTQADEEAKTTRSSKLRRKADSLLRLGRPPKTAHNGDESTEGSLVDGQSGGHSVNGGSEKASAQSPKSPRFFRMWPFKKQVAA